FATLPFDAAEAPDGPASATDGPASATDGPASATEGPASETDGPASATDRPASGDGKPASGALSLIAALFPSEEPSAPRLYKVMYLLNLAGVPFDFAPEDF
ncbi:hypothetical protein T484DRAFT_1855066, partial [Baffinella frigidus]